MRCYVKVRNGRVFVSVISKTGRRYVTERRLHPRHKTATARMRRDAMIPQSVPAAA